MQTLPTGEVSEMGMPAIEGIYCDGAITLVERPEGVRRARVIVTFLPEGADARRLEPTDTRRVAIARMLARMKQGIDFGGERLDRASLYSSRAG